MEYIDKLISAGPLTLSLLALVLVLALGIRLFPYLKKGRDNERDEREDARTASDRVEYARADRVEDVSRRVHDLSARVGDVKLMDSRVKTLEVFMDRSRAESGDLRVQIAQLTGGMETQTAKLEDLCERIDRNDEVMGGRIERLEDKIDGLTTHLLKS